jgi:pilus assembly protein CpaF
MTLNLNPHSNFPSNRPPETASALAQAVNNAGRTAETYTQARDEIMQQVRRQRQEQFTSSEASKDNAKQRSIVRSIAQKVVEQYQQTMHNRGCVIDAAQAESIINDCVTEFAGFGFLDTYLQDERVEEILINGAKLYLITSQGKQVVNPNVASQETILDIINRLVSHTGRQVNMMHPILDAQLPDGSRINCSIEPIAKPSPAVTIRRHRMVARSMENLIHLGSLEPDAAAFLTAAVQTRCGILVCGGTGSGKTNFLNVLAGLMDPSDRIVVIEDTQELQLPLDDVLYMQVRYANTEGEGEIGQSRLVQNALRQRPDRIVVGEVRGGEALDMLMASNTGHEGFLSTVHANSAVDAMDRLIQLCFLVPGMNIPLEILGKWVADAFQVIVHLSRDRSNQRRVMEILEVTGRCEGRLPENQPIFKRGDDGRLARSTLALQGHILDRFLQCGIDPKTQFPPAAQAPRPDSMGRQTFNRQFGGR